MSTFDNTPDPDNHLTETVIAYVYGGETPPDFAAIAASGFGAVALDNTARWFTDCMIGEAKRHGLIAVAFPMAYSPTRPAIGRR